APGRRGDRPEVRNAWRPRPEQGRRYGDNVVSRPAGGRWNCPPPRRSSAIGLPGAPARRRPGATSRPWPRASALGVDRSPPPRADRLRPSAAPPAPVPAGSVVARTIPRTLAATPPGDTSAASAPPAP